MAKDKSKDKQGHKKEKQSKEVTPLSSNGADSINALGEQEAMGRREFEKEIDKLQVELVKMQEWVKESGAKVCILFEGRDAPARGASSSVSPNAPARVFFAL